MEDDDIKPEFRDWVEAWAIVAAAVILRPLYLAYRWLRKRIRPQAPESRRD